MQFCLEKRTADLLGTSLFLTPGNALMDDSRFDGLAKMLIKLADSRRGVFRFVFAGVGAFAVGALGNVDSAAKKGKKKGKKGNKRKKGLCRPGTKFCNGACIPNSFWGCAREGAYGPEECDDNACYVEQYVCANGRCVPGCWEQHVACGGRCLEVNCRRPRFAGCNRTFGSTSCEEAILTCSLPFDPGSCGPVCPPPGGCVCVEPEEGPIIIACNCPVDRPNNCSTPGFCCCLPPCEDGKTFDSDTCECVT